jgi:chromate reductase
MLNQNASGFTNPIRPRLLLFPASLRRESHQRRLIEYLAVRLGDCCDVDILRSDEVDLPLFNQDLEKSPTTLDALKALHRRFNMADGVIVASPEYNGHISPYLKNTVDWISRLERIDSHYVGRSPFRDRPLLLSSASTGWTGGILGLQDARAIFAYLGHLVVADQICVADADQWLRGGSFQFEPSFAAHIDRVLKNFVALVTRLQATGPKLALAQGSGVSGEMDCEYV